MDPELTMSEMVEKQNSYVSNSSSSVSIEWLPDKAICMGSTKQKVAGQQKSNIEIADSKLFNTLNTVSDRTLNFI